MSTAQARSFLDSVAGYTNGTAGPVSSADKPILIGVIDPNYTAGLPKVTFDGETALSSRGYAWASGYSPNPGDRVYLMPVGQSYLIGGSIQSNTAYIIYRPLALQNGWGTYDNSSTPTWGPPRVTRSAGGLVKLSGMISGGTITNGTVIATLTAPFIPLISQSFVVDSADASVGITVNTDGTIVLNGGSPSALWMSLDTIIFNNDPNLTWNTPTLLNGWANAGYPNPAPQYAKDAFGRLWNRGVATNATTPTADQIIFTLPAGYRPDWRPHVANLGSSVFGFHEFNSSGNYMWKVGSGSATDFWIDQGVAIASGVATWTNATYLNSWVSYDTTNFAPARYWKDADGIVHLQGLMKNGTIGATVFTLPAGYRPKYKMMYATASLSALGRCDVQTDGSVVATKGNNGWFSLDGISFPAEQ